MRLARRWILAGVVLMGLGCSDGSEQRTPAPVHPPSPRPSPSSSTTVPAAAVPPSTVAAPATAEDGRRLLDERGIDVDQLSKDVAEQMRRRFDAQPAR